jgi:ubiquinone/menaquinone biosynthesis C-methylase UbiE
MKVGEDNIDWDRNWTEVQKNSIYYEDVSFFNYIREYLPSSFKILELGCGVALWAQVWMKLHGEYYGIDFSPEAINKARQKFPQCKFILDSVYNMDKFNEKFDVVFTNTFLQHIKNENKGLIYSKIHSILNNNGLLLTQEKADVDTPTTMIKDRHIEFIKKHGFQLVKFENSGKSGFLFRKV